MKNFKKKLSAIMVVGLISTVASNVTACSYNKTILNLPAGVTNVLGLTDNYNNPKITPFLFLDKTNNSYSWSSNLATITGKSFVNKDLSAKNDDCSSLLKTTFKLIPDINGKFNSEQLDGIIANIDYLPNISKNIDNDDFYVSGGTLELQFIKDKINIGEIYSVNLKSGFNSNSLIADELWNLLVTTADFNTTGTAIDNPLYNGSNGFKVGENIQDLTNKTCHLWTEADSKVTNNDKIIASLSQILGIRLHISISEQSQISGKWSDKDYVTLKYNATKGKETVATLYTSHISPNPA